MKGKLNLILVISLLFCGCEYEVKKESIENVIIEEEIIDSSSKDEKVENLDSIIKYENIENGLLSQNNEHELDVSYMLLDENNKKVGDEMTPTYIVIHNTANSAPAINEVKYLNSSSNTSSTSFHFAVDESEIYQAINLKYNAWHAGNVAMNKKSIGIEIAKSTISDVQIKDRAIENAAKLTAILMKHYSIPLDKVITHNDVTGKNCPHDILERYGWDNFLDLVKEYI